VPAKTTRKPVPAKAGKTRSKPAAKPAAEKIKNSLPPTGDPETIKQAIEELGFNRPFYTCKVVGNRLEFSLYGGDLIYWPPEKKRAPRKQGKG
jgi:hypothetical protein